MPAEDPDKLVGRKSSRHLVALQVRGSPLWQVGREPTNVFVGSCATCRFLMGVGARREVDRKVVDPAATAVASLGRQRSIRTDRFVRHGFGVFPAKPLSGGSTASPPTDPLASWTHAQ